MYYIISQVMKNYSWNNWNLSKLDHQDPLINTIAVNWI